MLSATTIGIHTHFHPSPKACHTVMVGAAMRATTTGRIPLKIASTVGLSFTSLANIASNKMITKLGMVPKKAQTSAPKKP